MVMKPTPQQFAEWLSTAMEGKPMEYMHGKPGALAGDVARLAYAAGADAELEACCEWLSNGRCPSWASSLRFARRPKPSRKQQAAEQILALLDEMKRHGLDVPAHDIILAVIADSPNDITP